MGNKRSSSENRKQMRGLQIFLPKGREMASRSIREMTQRMPVTIVPNRNAGRLASSSKQVGRRVDIRGKRAIQAACSTSRLGPVFAAVARNERIAAGGLWASLVAAAVTFNGGGAGVDDVQLVKNIITASTTYSVEDILASGGTFFYLFNAMGVLPAITLALLLQPEDQYKVKAWPFITASFGFGAFALLPYFMLRGPRDPGVVAGDAGNVDAKNQPSLPKRIGNSKLNAALLSVLSLLLLYGAISSALPGHTFLWERYTDLYRSSKLVHVTTLDFIALSLIMPYAVRLDAAERSGRSNGYETNDHFRLSNLAYLPLVGPALYLLLRPSLPANKDM